MSALVSNQTRSFSDLSFKVLPVSGPGDLPILVGRAMFPPGTGIPCHCHSCDETVTVIQGSAVCHVAGKTYRLGMYETLHVPARTPHCSANASTSEEMVMLCLYNSAQVDREVLDGKNCFPPAESGGPTQGS
jgi:quercetin dioxygenase-like cupin family protein